MAAATTTLIAAGLAGGAIFGALRSKAPKMPAPPVIPLPPEPERLSGVESQRRRKRQMAITGNSGRKSTLLTGPAGLDLQPPQKKTLLGS